MTAKPAKGIQPLQAELLARHISTGYANTCSYGNSHPLTRKACKAAYQALGEALEVEPVLTLMSDRGSLFVEKHPVGTRFNPKRLVKTFAEIGLESVTFEAGIIHDDLKLLFSILADPGRFPSVADAEKELTGHNVDSIRFNHIVYRKLTSDQKVVSSDEVGEEAEGPSRYAAGAAMRVLHELDAFMSLGRVTENPDQAGEQLAASYVQGDEDSRKDLVEHLRRLVREIESGGSPGASALSPEDLFLAMNTLRRRVRQSISARMDVDRIVTEKNEVISEVDRLTYSTLTTLVRDEYRSGKYSARRMAQVINRMLPDPGDLRRMLPQLKQALIEEGMSLKAYAELVHELSTGLRGEHLVRALESGAESIGLDVEEIVAQIQEDPTEAARLVVLAAELRHGTSGSDRDQLSAAFSDYIERIGKKLASEAAGGGRNMDTEALKEQLSKVQRELVARMSRDSDPFDGTPVPPLDTRIEQAADDGRMHMLSALLESNEGMSPTLVMEWLEHQLLTPTDLDRMRGPISRIMEKRGYNADQVSDMLSQIADRLNRTEHPPLPQAVLSVRDTGFFLKREVLSAQRYATPFCVVVVHVGRIIELDDTSRRPDHRELGQLLPEVYARIIRQARDLDLIGSLDESMRAIPLLILPMTDQTGGEIVRDRLARIMADYPFQLAGREVSVEVHARVVGYDLQDKPDYAAYVKQLPYQQPGTGESAQRSSGTA